MMRALSIRQPWAGLIVSGAKRLEVRSWPTKHRGPLLVCAGAAVDRNARHLLAGDELRGHAIGVVEVVGCRPGTAADAEACGGFDPTGYYVWEFERPRAVEPFPVLGRLGLFDVAESLARERVAMALA
jgi:hypothetical protein